VVRSPLSRRFAGPAADAGIARLALVIGLAAVIVTGGGTAALLSGTQTRLTAIGSSAAPRPTPAPPAPVVAIAGQRVAQSGVTVPWQHPLSLAVTEGTLRSVTATGPLGAVAGTLTRTRWTGRTTLLPSSAYVLHAVVADRDGKLTRLNRTVHSSAAENVLHANLSPDGLTVGVGSPVIVRLDQAVTGPAARAALLQRLHVATSPEVEGAWHFYNSYEVHYRPREYWAPGTNVQVQADLRRFRVPGTTTWGSDIPRSTSFTIGDSLISTVDITAHTMAVTRNGQLLRVLPVSTGRAIYPTKGGVHIILTVEKEHLYDSSTVGIPTDGPDGYYEKLPFSMRISNAGAFVHANPATVKYQGRQNVSHGCINLSLDDAHWFYSLSHRGDVVDVIHAVIAPVVSDAGMADWNYTWEQWKAGNLA